MTGASGSAQIAVARLSRPEQPRLLSDPDPLLSLRLAPPECGL